MSAAPQFHLEVLPPAQQAALRLLAPVATAQGFYLGGGTALAIQLGHRRSMDFDWFREPAIPDPLALAARLQAVAPFQTLQVAEDTLHGAAADIATSFFRFAYPLRRPLVTWPAFGCQLAAPADIASMKMSAVAQRGARKDFVDVFALGRSGLSLAQMLEEYKARFGIADVAHLLVALSYFDDAEREPMPEMLWSVDWTAIKSEIQAWVKAYAG